MLGNAFISVSKVQLTYALESNINKISVSLELIINRNRYIC